MPSVANTRAVRAPDLALTGAEIAELSDGVRLFRFDRPPSAVRISGASGWMRLAVRVNLIAREPTPGLASATRLKQCLAPDYFVVVAPKQSVWLAAHDAQLILRLDVEMSKAEALAGAPLDLSPIAGRLIADGFITGIVERLHITGGETDSGSLKESLLRSLLLTLARLCTHKSTSKDHGGLTARQLALLRDHVETRLGEVLRTRELARLADLSPFHFARAFKQSMGATPNAWIKLRRMTVAQRLLGDPSLKIADVAAAIGYESPSRFAVAFRTITGATPSAFRRTILAKPSSSTETRRVNE